MNKFTEAWNGIPVMVQHPEKNKHNISANSPDVIDSLAVGRVYNTKVSGKKLKGEVWLDEKKLKHVSPLAYGYIMQQHPLDVSVGVFTDEIIKAGEWNGEKYGKIAINYRPDHLALLPGGKGACSWEDGCGIRVNRKGDSGMINVYLKYSGTESTSWEGPTLGDFGAKGLWQDLGASEKARIANHFLLGGSGADDFGELKLPVVNPKTGKLNEGALRAVIGGRGAQVKGVPAEQLSSARKKAYSLLNSEFDAKLEIPKTLEKIGGTMEKKIKELLELTPSVYVEKDKEWLKELKEEQVDKLLACAKAGKIVKDGKAEIEKRDKQIETLKAKVVDVEKADKQIKTLEAEIVELKKGTPQVNEEVAMKFLKEKISDIKTFGELLPEDFKKQFEYGQKLYTAHRQELIKHIMDNQAQKVWDEESLKTQADETLQKIADSIKKPVDYSAASGEFNHDVFKGEVLLPPGVGTKKE